MLALSGMRSEPIVAFRVRGSHIPRRKGGFGQSVKAELKDHLTERRPMDRPALRGCQSPDSASKRFAYEIKLIVSDFLALYDLSVDASHKDPPFNPRMPQQFASDKDIFTIIREGDVLLHHPYDSFAAVMDFLNTAADDPDVLAIKQTLYRIGKDSPVVAALCRAAENGKQVTAVVELKARFDEEHNIDWARQMEESGVNAVFRFVAGKRIAKATLVVRREGKLRRYVHVSSGNYNTVTAKIYTDIGLFTCDRFRQ